MEDEGDCDEEKNPTLILRHPGSTEAWLLERLSRLEASSLDHEERLKFLDPELKATHSRIDVVEMECDANSSELAKLKSSSKSKIFVANNIQTNISSHTSSNYSSSTISSTFLPQTPPPTPTPLTSLETPKYCTEMEELWEHALDVLDERDVSDLYQFQDESGILETHKRHFEHVKQDANTKDKYFELIKMLLEREMSEKNNWEKYRDIKEVRKIQGYQDLTNKLFRRMTKTLVNNYVQLKERMDKIEGLLGSGGDFILVDKLNDLDNKIEELQKQTEKIPEIKEENLSHNTRLGWIEGEVREISEKIKNREELDIVEAEQMRIQKEVFEVLEKRVDQNEKHLEMLTANDARQDEALTTLESQLPNLDTKLSALESADEFFQEAHKEVALRTQTIEAEGKQIGISLKDLSDALDKLKEDKEMDDEKTKAKLELLAHDDQDIRKKLDEFIEKTEEVDERQNKDLEALENDIKIIQDEFKSLQTDFVDGKESETSDIGHLKKNIEDVGEKVRQLEGISNQNADVINEFTINHITYNSKFNQLEGEAHEFSEKVREMIDGNRRDINDNGENIKQLFERVKYNYDRLDVLSEIPLKVQNLENVGEENAVNAKFIRDKLEHLESNVNNNSEKIAIETDWREKGDNELANKIEQLKREGEALMAHLEETDEKVRQNLEKIIGLEEVHVIHQEKAVYVETLASRVSAMDEQKQQSEARLKEEVEDNVQKNKDAIQHMWQHFEDRLNEIRNENNNQNGQLGDLRNKSQELQEEIDRIRNESKHLVGEELEKLFDRVKEKLGEIDALCGKNEKHVENLRELNGKLLEDMERNKADNLSKMDEKLENIRREIPDIDKEDFDHLVSVKFQTEAKLNELADKAQHLENELERTKQDVEGKHEHTHVVIRETNERTELRFQHLSEKLVIIERTDDDLRRELEALREESKNKDENLEEQIRVVDTEVKHNIVEVEKQVEEKTRVAQAQLKGMRIDLDINRRDLWTIFLEMYGSMRCYTVVMKSEGGAAYHQSACLGVYRSVDWTNNHPVYKQENGENYLYYNANNKCWMVASHVGNEYAWMRYPTSDGEDHDSSSSSSSSSSSDDDDHHDGSGDDEKRIKKKVKKATGYKWKDVKTPDLFHQGWQYKLSPLQMSEDTFESWMTDDASLRVEPLGDDRLIVLVANKVDKNDATISPNPKSTHISTNSARKMDYMWRSMLTNCRLLLSTLLLICPLLLTYFYWEEISSFLGLSRSCNSMWLKKSWKNGPPPI